MQFVTPKFYIFQSHWMSAFEVCGESRFETLAPLILVIAIYDIKYIISVLYTYNIIINYHLYNIFVYARNARKQWRESLVKFGGQNDKILILVWIFRI